MYGRKLNLGVVTVSPYGDKITPPAINNSDINKTDFPQKTKPPMFSRLRDRLNRRTNKSKLIVARPQPFDVSAQPIYNSGMGMTNKQIVIPKRYTE